MKNTVSSPTQTNVDTLGKATQMEKERNSQKWGLVQEIH